MNKQKSILNILLIAFLIQLSFATLGGVINCNSTSYKIYYYNIINPSVILTTCLDFTIYGYDLCQANNYSYNSTSNLYSCNLCVANDFVGSPVRSINVKYPSGIQKTCYSAFLASRNCAQYTYWYTATLNTGNGEFFTRIYNCSKCSLESGYILQFYSQTLNIFSPDKPYLVFCALQAPINNCISYIAIYYDAYEQVYQPLICVECNNSYFSADCKDCSSTYSNIEQTLLQTQIGPTEIGYKISWGVNVNSLSSICLKTYDHNPIFDYTNINLNPTMEYYLPAYQYNCSFYLTYNPSSTNSPLGTCIYHPIENCASYSNIDSTCSTCYDRFYLLDQVCNAVNPVCQNYNPITGNCTSCISGNVLRTNNGDCVAEILNCQTHNTQTGQCTICKDRFYLLDQVCNAVNPVCQNYDPITGNCTSCISGNVLRTNNGDCVAEILNCQTHNTQTGQCTICEDRFYLLDQVCNAVNPVCQNYDPITGNCTSCISGNVLRTNNGDCVAEILNCQTHNTQTGQCTICKDRFYLLDQVCNAVNPVCQNYDPITGNCTSCISGNVLRTNNGDCVAEILNCQTHNTQTGQCTICEDRFYLLDQVCNAVNPVCQNYDPITGNCTSCISGNVLRTNNGDCVAEILNCQTHNTQTGQCTICEDRFYLLDQVCNAVNPVCQNYDPITGNCTSCISGNVLRTNNGDCVAEILNCQTHNTQTGQCTICEDRFYLLDQVCNAVNPVCQNYDPITGNCTSCISGNVLRTNNGDCVAEILNCQTHNTQTGQCTICEDRFYLLDQVCNAVNPVCQNYDPITGNCTSCISGNVLRTNNGDCVAETSNCQSYNLQTGKCNLCNCHYQLSGIYTCIKLQDGCAVYQNQNICSSVCLSCESNYILNPKTQSCIHKVSHCKKYKLNGKCKLCQNRFYLQNQICVQVPVQCTSYNSKGWCLSCIQNYIVQNHKCIYCQSQKKNIKSNGGKCKSQDTSEEEDSVDVNSNESQFSSSH